MVPCHIPFSGLSKAALQLGDFVFIRCLNVEMACQSFANLQTSNVNPYCKFCISCIIFSDSYFYFYKCGCQNVHCPIAAAEKGETITCCSRKCRKKIISGIISYLGMLVFSRLNGRCGSPPKDVVI